MDTGNSTGHLILVMAPSGSGKGTLLAHIRERFPEIHFAVSCTTRAPRPGEREGETYFFLSEEEFNAKIAEGAFVEWAYFSGHRYGTLVSEILTPMRAGRVVMREVELQGIRAMQERIPAEHRTIAYVDAGPWEALRRRIEMRAPISPEHLATREARYREESRWRTHADVVIENYDGALAEAKEEFERIVAGVLARVGKT